MSEILELIKKYQKIIITRHVCPDFDAYSSQIGLYLSLKNTFKNKSIYMVGDENENNIYGIKMDALNTNDYKDALLIICDTACKNMLPNDYYNHTSRTIIIDHHENKPDIDGLYLIKSKYSSASEVVAEFIIDNKLYIDKKIADTLFVGIVGDSNRFLYKGTSSNTFKVVSTLIDNGADIINDYSLMIKEEKESTKRIKGYILSSFKIDKHVAYYYVDYKTIMSLKTDPMTASRGSINLLSNLKNIDAHVGFVENEIGDIYTEIRSKKIPLVDISKKYGGGGHELACGITLKGGFDINRIINDINEVIDNEHL